MFDVRFSLNIVLFIEQVILYNRKTCVLRYKISRIFAEFAILTQQFRISSKKRNDFLNTQNEHILRTQIRVT